MKSLDTFSKRIIVIAASVVAIILSASVFMFALAAMPRAHARSQASAAPAAVIDGYTIVGAVGSGSSVQVVGVKVVNESSSFYSIKTFSSH